jgi:hypothetical protein
LPLNFTEEMNMKTQIAFDRKSFFITLEEMVKKEGVEEFLFSCPEITASLPSETSPFPRGTDSPVLLTDSEVQSLTEKLGGLRLGFWVKVLSDYAAMSPAKFRKYKSHRAVIETWDRTEVGKGKEFVPDHPNGPGFYPLWVAEKHRAATPFEIK